MFPALSYPSTRLGVGQVREWLKRPVSKTGVPARVPWVRIPPCPLGCTSLLDAPGCRSCELLVQRDDPTRLAIIEVWDSVEAHQASVSRIPPGLLQQAQTLFAVPARGAYYEPLGKGTGGTAA